MGGEAIRPSGPWVPPFALGDGAGWTFVDSGRSALHWLLLPYRSARVHLPAYSCPALTQAVLDAACRPHFYHAQGPDHPAKGDVLVVVHNFGWRMGRPLLSRLRQEHPHLVIWEDASHTLTNARGKRWLGPPWTDGAFASLRKCLPTPAGGIARRWATASRPERWPDPDPHFVRHRLSALERPNAVETANVLAAAESWLEHQHTIAALDQVSRSILQELPSQDDGMWRTRCRKNWGILQQQLQGGPGTGIHTALPEGVCPLGYLIRHPNRSDLARSLLDHGICASLHWRLTGPSRAAATLEERRLAGTVLTLPCDGRYGSDDMLRLAQLVMEPAPIKRTRPGHPQHP